MSNHVRVTVEAGDDTESARLYEDEGEMEVGDASFRFSVSGTGSDATSENGSPEERTTDRDRRHVAPLGAVPSDGTLRCEAIAGQRGVEVILYQKDGTVFAWRNSCPHEPEVRLDPGSGAIFSDDQLVCHAHGARFGCGDGVCSYGPCQGDELDQVEVQIRDGDVYLTDERFDGCRRLDS